MKLKKLLTLDFIQEFQKVLSTDFENELFIASLRNYASHGNPLRFHNFAFSMRELVLTVIERKAPNDDVIKAVWYEREHETYEVTRRQKLKYCGQGQLADEYIDSNVLDDLNKHIKDYLKAFNFFNKYTHITEKHFNAHPKKFFEDTKRIIQKSMGVIEELEDLENIIRECLDTRIHQPVIDKVIESMPDSLSILANHVYIEYSQVEELYITHFDNKHIYVDVAGTIYISQEYGPKDDILILDEDYPFKLEMIASVSDPDDISTISELDVDTSSWYE